MKLKAETITTLINPDCTIVETEHFVLKDTNEELMMYHLTFEKDVEELLKMNNVTSMVDTDTGAITFMAYIKYSSDSNFSELLKKNFIDAITAIDIVKTESDDGNIKGCSLWIKEIMVEGNPYYALFRWGVNLK